MVSFWISVLFNGSSFSCSSETLQYLTITNWKNPKEDQQLLQKMKNLDQEYKILNAELEGFISHEL